MKRISRLILFLLTAVVCSACSSEHTLELSQKANHSSGSYWEYELNTDAVLKEVNYTETSFLGPGYTQHWTFEVIGEGEVTVQWLAYQGSFYQEKKSYSVTYAFDHEGNLESIK